MYIYVLYVKFGKTNRRPEIICCKQVRKDALSTSLQTYFVKCSTGLSEDLWKSVPYGWFSMTGTPTRNVDNSQASIWCLE